MFHAAFMSSRVGKAIYISIVDSFNSFKEIRLFTFLAESYMRRLIVCVFNMKLQPAKG